MAVAKMPKKCRECKFVGDYTSEAWSEYPHYYCDLMFALYDEDYKVDPDRVDKYCPLKSNFAVTIEEE